MKSKLYSFVSFSALLILVLSLFLATVGDSAARYDANLLTLISVASGGTQGNGVSEWPSISGDGQYVAFSSAASNLVPGDTNEWWDVFVHDRTSKEITRVSVASDGSQGNLQSKNASIFADGRYVVFESIADNLVPADSNGTTDIFVRDRVTGETRRVSVASNGQQGNFFSREPSISADGHYVAFASWSTNLVTDDDFWTVDIYVHDLDSGTTTCVSLASDGSEGNDDSREPSISGDGRYVAFHSKTDNLVAGDINEREDVFIHDRLTGETKRVSVASDGTPGNDYSKYPAISGDGRYVAFESNADNRVVGDTNEVPDIFVHDLQTGQITRVSVASDGGQSNAYSGMASISADGRFVAFTSWATTLTPAAPELMLDVFAHDRETGETYRISNSYDGKPVDNQSEGPSISSSGRFVAFQSAASNLISGDKNDTGDIFVCEGKCGNGSNAGYRLYLPLILRGQ
jgi:Tol biopolymer transport system component